MARRSTSVRSATLLVLCLALVGCGGSGAPARESDLLVFGVAPDYDEIAENIVAVRPDGRGLRTLTRGVPGYSYSPVVSPDGAHIAFSVSESLTPPESSAWVMAADGTQHHRLVRKRDGYSYAESWSPDGKHVLYSLVRSRADGELVDRGIWMVGIDGSDRRRLESRGAWGESAWSPDGSRLLFMTDEETFAPLLHVLDVRTGRSRPLARGALPRWTPDGKRIVFKRIFAGRRSGYYVVDVDGGSPELLERFGAEDDPWLGGVSPDGEWVLLGYYPGVSKISLDDGELQELTTGESDWAPAWSPDGERIAFERDGDIWVMDADGSDEHVVAQAPRLRVYTRPHWLP